MQVTASKLWKGMLKYATENNQKLDKWYRKWEQSAYVGVLFEDVGCYTQYAEALE